jgi:hypothetical protein
MQPTRALWESQADLVAADTTKLAAATALHVHLAKAPVTPSLDSVIGDLTEATFTGSAALAVTTGTQTVYYDMATGKRVVELKEPAGGWHWQCTVTPGAAETIYAVYLTDNADAVLYGIMLLATPITISAAGQGLDVGFIQFAWNTNSPM